MSSGILNQTVERIASFPKENVAWIIPLVVSLYLVWVSQLRGARIKLLEIPKIKIREPALDEIRRSPDRILIEKFHILFINYGNRSGIVKDVTVKFKPSKRFKKYLRECTPPKPFRAPDLQGHDLLIIKDRSTDVLLLEMGRIDLKKEISKDFEEVNWENIFENDNLFELIGYIFENKKRNLEDFVRFVETGGKFGEFVLNYTHSGSKRVISEGLKHDEVILIFEQPNLEPAYRILLEGWDSIDPHFKTKFDSLLNFLDQCTYVITGHREDFSKSEPNEVCHLRNFPLIGEFNETWEFNLLKKWTKSKELMGFIEVLFNKIREFKDQADKLSRLYPTAREMRERELLELQRGIIETFEDRRIEEIQRLKEKLTETATEYS